MKYYSPLEMKGTLTCYNLDEPWRYYAKGNKPVPKGQIWFQFYEVPREVTFMQTESRGVITRGWVERETGSCSLKGTEFQFCRMQRVLETAQWYKCPTYHWWVHIKTVKWWNFMVCIFYHNWKKGNYKLTAAQPYVFIKNHWSVQHSGWVLWRVQHV